MNQMANAPAPEILRSVNAHLTRKGLMLKRGSIVDATIIAAPSSTKNEAGARPVDASGEEGQPVALRDEGAHWGGCRFGAGAHGGDHACERVGCRAGR